ncbi:dihydrolipoyllysine-residue acetyltransferase component of pyruvate dehydrogenase complex [Paraliobacillus ryukyuensis]|uniref:Dihydrolipoamide acetyltransferase component of pyruvate dehydrogenase complex n=1 Tax=Paraliobacillus ryukyuensis TaxID=200904 RepID=A0A366EG91_9BACI|nr:dihydrolipoamide acetyltransferase family protein [Paraliobacillus ryukyuensis]RBP01451.1 branched-chain alpha-keto acid dehydrogenase E2 component [Paraliobacillus ryukyuensis]
MGLENMKMPQLGESVTEGTINTWLVKPGDKVNKYDPIVEVLTDKVNAEVPSSFSGTIKEIFAQEDETVAVGDVICSIETAGDESQVPASNETTNKVTEETVEKTEVSAETSMKTRYSPAVMRLAQENNLDLSNVKGSGKAGRITRKDVERMIANGSQQMSEPEQTEDISVKQPKPVDFSLENGDKEIPVTGVRKAIATNMVRSTTEIPHAWMMIEVDVTNLVKYRNAEKLKFKENEGYSLTYFAFFLSAVAKALKKFPELNSSWAGDKIIQYKDINLSIAVAHEKELFVPVIKNVDEKSIKGIAKEIYQLATKAKNGKLTQEDMSGGTFTVNNTGSFGSVQSMGVINHPQAAILQVESIVKRPVIIDDMFAARDMVNLCLSIDHRILDGVVSGDFMSEVKTYLENVSATTTPIY